jgi:hypothetical protein
VLGLKLETGYTPTKLNLLRIYKNSLLVKFLRRFDVADDHADIYSDDENPKIKKIVNKMVGYTSDKKKPGKKKLKVRKSHIRHRVTMPGDSKRNREKLIKIELEYSDILESEEKESLE